MHFKRSVLLSGLTLLAIAAALGIWILIFETFFGLEEEIFASIGSVTLFSVPILAALWLRERDHWRLMMVVDFLIGVFGLLYFLALSWGILQALLDQWYWMRDPMWKTMIALAVWTWAIPWAAVLAYFDLRGWTRWVQILSVTVTLFAALSISAGLFIERYYDDLVWKSIGVTGILTLLGTIATPVLYKIVGIEKIEQVESTPMQLKLTCPRCLLEQTVPHGHSRCRQCRLKFEIRIEEPRCQKCNYLLHQLTTPVCPECGTRLSQEEIGMVVG